VCNINAQKLQQNNATHVAAGGVALKYAIQLSHNELPLMRFGCPLKLRQVNWRLKIQEGLSYYIRFGFFLEKRFGMEIAYKNV